jgi:hypothetical protein
VRVTTKSKRDDLLKALQVAGVIAETDDEGLDSGQGQNELETDSAKTDRVLSSK